MLAMFEPMTLPTAKPGLLSIDAKIETSTSGAEVPKPKTTTPIIRGEMFKWVAVLAAPSMKMSELQTRRASPTSNTKLGKMSVIVIQFSFRLFYVKSLL